MPLDTAADRNRHWQAMIRLTSNTNYDAVLRDRNGDMVRARDDHGQLTDDVVSLPGKESAFTDFHLTLFRAHAELLKQYTADSLHSPNSRSESRSGALSDAETAITRAEATGELCAARLAEALTVFVGWTT